MNKHWDISFLCLFATQNQQGNALLNILSLVVRAEKKIKKYILDFTQKPQNISLWKIQIIPFWNMLLSPSYKKNEFFQFGIFRANSPNNKACSRVLL